MLTMVPLTEFAKANMCISLEVTSLLTNSDEEEFRERIVISCSQGTIRFQMKGCILTGTKLHFELNKRFSLVV
jgi:hypothetical protein